MAVPDFQTLMLPFLQILEDRQEHTLSKVIDILGSHFNLSDAELTELLPSGKQARFTNRVGWTQTHLAKAGLLEKTGRGRFQITERGIQVVSNPPEKITMQYLMRFPEFVQFRNASRTPTSSESTLGVHPDSDATPQESLEANYQILRRTLAQELLERIKSCSPRFFETLVVDLLVAMGYGGSRKDAGQAVGRSGDDGIDGIIKEDKLGLDAVYIQAKRWEATVGRPVAQSFAGSLDGQRARKGILITTSTFSSEAWDYVGRIEKKIVLIDGELLTQLMIEHNVGVAEVSTYTIKKVDPDYFDEE